jgi:tRNA A-37 threonylcarbamoyl transferase component Bud32
MAERDRIGTELAGYRLLEIIGRGGASVVYLAEHLRLGRRAALKVLAPQLAHDEAFRERFIRESRTAAGLDHPNIVPVYDAGEADGVLYLAMRYVQGDDLGKVIRSTGAIEPWRTLAIVAQVAAALDVAHAEGLVHRDVKPGNILLTHDRGTGMERAFLSDFGLTKRVASTGGGLTRSGQFVGTVDYVAPEQILGEPVDGRTDVYSLGCVLFHCLRGSPPFARPNEVGTIYAHVHEPAPALTQDGSRRIDAVIGRALTQDRTHRYGTCSDLVEAARSAIQADPIRFGEAAGRSERAGDDGAPIVEEPATVVIAEEPATPVGDGEPATAVIPRHATTDAPAAPARPGSRRRRTSVGWIGAAALLALGVAILSNVLAPPSDRTERSPDPTTPSPASPTPSQEARGPDYFWLAQGDWLVQPVEGENEIMNTAIVTTDDGLLGVGHADPSSSDEDAAVWSSPNGRMWRRVDAEPLRAPGYQRLADVAAFGERYVAVGYSGDDAAVWATDAGDRGWHLVQRIPEPGLQVMRKIIARDGGLLVVGRNELGGDIDAASWTSEDGSTWTRVEDEALEGLGDQAMWTAVKIDGVIYGLGETSDRFGATDPAVWRLDDDGWSIIDIGLSRVGEQEFREIAVGADGTAVAVGIDGEEGASDAAIWTSSGPSLSDWEPADGRFRLPEDQQLLTVVATSRGFVAMGWTGPAAGEHDGLVWTSPDGSEWRRPPARSNAMVQLGGPDNQEVRSLVEFGRQLLGVGVSGTVEEDAGLWVGTPVD